MTLNEIKHIAEIACIYNLDYEDECSEHIRKVLVPVREAIAANDQTVIAFIETCDKEVQGRLIPAIGQGLSKIGVINEGVIREGYERVVNLYRAMYDERGWKCEF